MSARTGQTGTPKAVARCPICRKPVVREHRPFCSKHCAEIDLGRWLNGSYAVPGAPADEEGEALPQIPDDWGDN